MKKIIFAFVLFFSSSAFAQSEKDIAVFIEGVGNKIISIAANKSLSEAKIKSQIINEIDSVIDSKWIARFVLGKNYKEMTQAQKDKFSELYRQFMINTYGPKFRSYNGRKFTVKSVEKQSIFYVAKCEFLPRDSDVIIDVSFRVKENDGKLLILDFVTEGVSLIETQRSEFNSSISQKGIEGFMKDLSKRVVELKKAN